MQTPHADGGVTLYVGPEAPTGLESSWIPTRGKRPLPTFRFMARRRRFSSEASHARLPGGVTAECTLGFVVRERGSYDAGYWIHDEWRVAAAEAP